MTMLLRLGVALARPHDRRGWWRVVAVAMATATATVGGLLAVALPLAVQTAVERTDDRRVEFTGSPTPDDVVLSQSAILIDGQTVEIAWIVPADPAGAPEPPDGARTFPPPGTSLISPGLASLLEEQPGFRPFFPDPTTIGDEGIRSPGELFAYLHPRRAADAPESAVGDRVRSIAASEGGSLFQELEFDIWTIVVGAVCFLVLPAAVVLSVGLRATSGIRDRRFAVLGALGAPVRSVRLIALAETMTIAGPVLLVTVLLAQPVTGRLGSVPLSGVEVVPGDLRLPWWGTATFVVVMLIVLAALVIATTTRPVALPRPQPAGRAEPVSSWAGLPFVLAAGLAVSSWTLSETWAFPARVLVIACVLVGVPLAVPAVVRVVGHAATRSSRLAVEIAGQRLAWAPVTGSRPVVAVATVTALLLGVFGYLAAISAADEPEPFAEGPLTAVAVELATPADDDLARLRSRLPEDYLVTTYRARSGTVTLETGCAAIRRLVDLPNCADGRPIEPTSTGALALRAALAGARGGFAEDVVVSRPSPSAAAGASERLMILGPDPATTVDAATTVALAGLGPVLIDSVLDQRLTDGGTLGWLQSGTRWAFLLLLTAAALAMVDRGLAGKDASRLLRDLGAPRRLVDRCAAGQFALAYLAATTTGSGIGMILAAFLRDSGTVYPWPEVVFVMGSVGVLGLLAVVGIVAFGAAERRLVRD